MLDFYLILDFILAKIGFWFLRLSRNGKIPFLNTEICVTKEDWDKCYNRGALNVCQDFNVRGGERIVMVGVLRKSSISHQKLLKYIEKNKI